MQKYFHRKKNTTTKKKNYTIKLAAFTLLWSLCGCALEPAGQNAENPDMEKSVDQDQDRTDHKEESQRATDLKENEPGDTTGSTDAAPKNDTSDENISYRDIIRDRIEENEILQKDAMY